MKVLAIASICFVAALGQQIVKPKTAVRNLPADVLRDFPGACFASTACRVFQVNDTWPLTPFCGQATCLFVDGVYVERVEDCGLRPKESPGCVPASKEEDLQKPFPHCCPQYSCEEGSTLQYPTADEQAALLKAAQAAQAAQAASQGASQAAQGSKASQSTSA